MIKLGITGGMGSGKTVVSKLLYLHGIPIYDADKEAKKLNETSSIIKNKLIKKFGAKLYADDGTLNKQMLAGLIFSNRSNLLFVNSVIHPELKKHFLEWTEQFKNNKIVAIDAAVLFEAGFNDVVDRIITVTSPLEMRIERTKQRDNISEERIMSRINSQWSDEERLKKSHFEIINDNQHSIIQQTEKIIEVVCNLNQ